jgi:hypothetical protein
MPKNMTLGQFISTLTARKSGLDLNQEIKIAIYTDQDNFIMAGIEMVEIDEGHIVLCTEEMRYRIIIPKEN